MSIRNKNIETEPIGMTAALHVRLSRMKDELSPEKLLRFAEKFKDAYGFYRKQLKKIPPGENRAHAVRKFVDQGLVKSMKTQDLKPSCGKGCAHCCHIPVMITMDEGIVLWNYSRAKKIPIDLELAKRQAEHDGTDRDFAQKPKSENRCIFLGDDNSCRVYKYRPASCRKYIVFTEPEKCDAFKPEEVITHFDLDVEVAVSASFDLEDSSVGSLAQTIVTIAENESASLVRSKPTD